MRLTKAVRIRLAAMLLAAFAAISGCSMEEKDAPAEPITEVTATLPITALPTTAPSDDHPLPSYTPAIIADVTQAADLDIIATAEWHQGEYISVWLTCDEALTDLLVSCLVAPDDSLTGNELLDSYNEAGSIAFVPLIEAGQVVLLKMQPNYPFRVAYTNAAGDYEAVVVLGREGAIRVQPVSPRLSDEWVTGELYFDYSDKDRDIDFLEPYRDYIPHGFQLADICLGDVDADGIADTLLTLVSAGPRVAAYGSDLPLFLLLGQADGGYSIAQKAPAALFCAYKNRCTASAGEGSIDLRRQGFSGGTLYTTDVRFTYDAEKDDWLLTGMAVYQEDYVEDGIVQMTGSPQLTTPPFYLDKLPLKAYSDKFGQSTALYYTAPEGLKQPDDLPNAIGLSADLPSAEKAARVQAYLEERGMYKPTPDAAAWRDDLPLAECYWDVETGKLSIVAHTWFDNGDVDSINCATLDIRALAPPEADGRWMLEDALKWVGYDAEEPIVEYSYDTMEYGSWGSSGWVRFDARGRAIEGSYYVTHGGHHRYYLYEDNDSFPWAIVDFCSFPYSGSEDGTSVYGHSFAMLLFPQA